jgi:hypothetical protein
LTIGPPHAVEPLTPLLSKGGELDPVIEGRLPGGVEGTLARLSYRGGGAAHDGSTWRFNFAHVRIPESQAVVPRLFCVRKGRFTDNVRYGMEIRHADLWTESVALSERFKVQTGLFQDPNWMRQLFSPSFIDWLATAEPPDFSFELAYGDLVGSIEEDDPDEATLTSLCEATAGVAERIRDECLE